MLSGPTSLQPWTVDNELLGFMVQLAEIQRQKVSARKTEIINGARLFRVRLVFEPGMAFIDQAQRFLIVRIEDKYAHLVRLSKSWCHSCAWSRPEPTSSFVPRSNSIQICFENIS